MSVGFNAVVDQIIKIVRATTPLYDQDYPFTVYEDGDGGYGATPEDPAARMRHVELELVTPAYDAGYAGYNGVVSRVELNVNVRYPAVGDRGRRLKMVGVDSGVLLKSLMNPNNWDSPTSGIHTIIPADEADVTLTTDIDVVYLSVPLFIEYREAN